MKPEWPALDQFSRAELLRPFGVRLRSVRYAHHRSASPRRGEAAGKESNLQKEIYTGFLRQAFGTPAHEPSQTLDRGQLGWYAAKTIGVGLQFGCNRKRTQVIVLRPQPVSEIIKRIPEALKRSGIMKRLSVILTREPLSATNVESRRKRHNS